jgi:hypothetical protein
MSKPDGIDVAIAAFFATRLTGGSTEEAERRAEAMLDFFGIERKALTHQTAEERE